MTCRADGKPVTHYLLRCPPYDALRTPLFAALVEIMGKILFYKHQDNDFG